MVATKQLLETLTHWSRGSASESDVSDVYVRLGYEFNIASRAFTSVGIDVSDLGPVPDTLRSILEETLSQEASQISLDKFLPRIRDIIINLLHGLKRKQQRLRQKTGREGSAPNATERRHGSFASTISSVGEASDSSQLYKDLSASRSAPGELSADPPTPARIPSPSAAVPPVSQRRDGITSSSQPRRTDSGGRSRNELEQSTSNSSMTSNAMQDIPVIEPPYPQESTIPGPTDSQRPRRPKDPSPARPPPRQQDALAALQRGGDLERRASRRFSAYQISKHLGTSNAGVPMIPPAQRSPIPNRGRDIRESMNAVRNRGSPSVRDTARNHQTTDASPNRKAPQVSYVRDETHEAPRLGDELQRLAPQTSKTLPDSPTVKTPEEKYLASPPLSHPVEGPSPPAIISKPLEEPQYSESDIGPDARGYDQRQELTGPDQESKINKGAEVTSISNESDDSTSLTLFLQYKTKVKKFVLAGGYQELSIPRLQLAFIEKFAWSTQSNGADLPDIYVQDQVSGVRHELEDLADVKNNSVLVLNVDDLGEMKRHFDEKFEGVKDLLQGVKAASYDHHSALQRIGERQQDAAKDLARVAAAPIPNVSTTSTVSSSTGCPAVRGSADHLGAVQSMKRDLAVMRQTYTSSLNNMDAVMSGLREKASAVKNAAIQASIPVAEGSSGRSYVEASKKSLNEESEKIINRVDDLQDLVEDLRKDVVTRGVRPLPRQLESVNKDIASATSDLRKLRDNLKREKPVWTKVGENELKAVCDDQNMLTMQEELAADLEDDLEKAAQTFTLVEEATKQQNLQNGPSNSSRSTSRTLNNVGGDVDPHIARGGVMSEVKALQPNHDNRIEAIERAERARRLELENRGLNGNAFKNELGNFVGESKLKKTGGVEEAERMRIVREERARKENYERAAARAAGLPDPTLPSLDSDASAVVDQLDIPNREDGGATSPEAEFVEAEESPPVNGVS